MYYYYTLGFKEVHTKKKWHDIALHNAVDYGYMYHFLSVIHNFWKIHV